MASARPGSHAPWGAFVVGASSGGLRAISCVLSSLPPGFELPGVVVLHVGDDSSGYFADVLAGAGPLPVRLAEEKLRIERGTVYAAPPGYHLLVEQDETFSVSLDSRVHFSRPSIDVLFESAADVWQDRLIGVVLTGANADGAEGALRIRDRGGHVIVQDPEDAEVAEMPRAAIEAGAAHERLPLKSIGPRLAELERLGATRRGLRRLEEDEA